MDRRAFLKFLAPAAIGGVIAAEELLSTRTYFLPPPKGWRHVDAMVTHPDLNIQNLERIINQAAESIAKRIDADFVNMYYGHGLLYAPDTRIATSRISPEWQSNPRA